MQFDDAGFEQEAESGDVNLAPFDPALIRVSIKTLTVDLLVSRIREGELDLWPGFQRQDVWNEITQSRLIESLIVKIPLPTFYIDAEQDDRWAVIDGLQRLLTFQRFILDQSLQLKGLEFLVELNGCSFSDLPRPHQRRVLETQLTVHIIEPGTPPAVKFNIFKRINTGGAPLSAQEIRHALHQGPASELLEELAQSEEFLAATGNSVSSKRMGDRECVLRFLAFVLTPYTEYNSQSFDAFLSDQMSRINAMGSSERERLADSFRNTMRLSETLFGKEAFRKPQSVFERRMPVNKALFEAWSVSLSQLSDQEKNTLVNNTEMLNDYYARAFLKEDRFYKSISYATGDISKVKERFSTIESVIQCVLDDAEAA